VTRAVSFTQASTRRLIEAARKAGLRVTGIRPDGTLIVDDQQELPVNAEKEDLDRELAEFKRCHCED
jgi:hypothetical protein